MTEPEKLKKALKESFQDAFAEIQEAHVEEPETPRKKIAMPTPKSVKQTPKPSFSVILSEASPQLSHFEARIEEALSTLDQFAEATKLQIKEPYVEFYKNQLSFVKDQRTLLEKLQTFATSLQNFLTEQALDSEIATLRADFADLKDNFNLFATKMLDIGEFKKENMQLEREVLTKIKAELSKK